MATGVLSATTDLQGEPPGPLSLLARDHYLASLLLDTSWIRRRVETAAFLDRTLLERRVTLDVDLSELARRAAAAATAHPVSGPDDQSDLAVPRLIAPIAVLEKQLLLDIDLEFGGERRAISTRAEDSRVAIGVLTHLLTEGSTSEPPSALLEYGSRLPIRGESEDAFIDRVALIEQAEDILKQYPSDDPLTEAVRHRLVYMFATNFLVLAELDTSRGGVSVVKLRYVHDEPGPSLPWWKRLGTSVPVRVSASSTGVAEREHLRLVAPPGTVLTHGQLTRLNDPGRPGSVRPCPDDPSPTTASPSVVKDVWWRITASRAHTYVRSGTCGANQRTLAFDVLLRPRVEGIVSSAWWSSGLIALTLGVIALWGLDNLQEPMADADAAIALLLAGPSVLTAYLARPNEHAYFRWLLRPLRILMIMTAVLPLVAGLSLMSVDDPRLLACIWKALAVLSTGVSLLTLWVKRRGVKAEQRLAVDAPLTHTGELADEVPHVLLSRLHPLDADSLADLLGVEVSDVREWRYGFSIPDEHVEKIRDLTKRLEPLMAEILRHPRPPVLVRPDEHRVIAGLSLYGTILALWFSGALVCVVAAAATVCLAFGWRQAAWARPRQDALIWLDQQSDTRSESEASEADPQPDAEVMARLPDDVDDMTAEVAHAKALIHRASVWAVLLWLGAIALMVL